MNEAPLNIEHRSFKQSFKAPPSGREYASCADKSAIVGMYIRPQP